IDIFHLTQNVCYRDYCRYLFIKFISFFLKVVLRRNEENKKANLDVLTFDLFLLIYFFFKIILKKFFDAKTKNMLSFFCGTLANPTKVTKEKKKGQKKKFVDNIFLIKGLVLVSTSKFLFFVLFFDKSILLQKGDAKVLNDLKKDYAFISLISLGCNASGAFNETTVEILARYSFVTIEKGQGENGTIPGYYAEDYMLQAAQQLKAANPDIKVFFYWNSVLDWEMYRMHYYVSIRHVAKGLHEFLDVGVDVVKQIYQWKKIKKHNVNSKRYFDGCDADRVWQLTIGGVNQLNYTTQIYYLNRKLTGMTYLQSYLNASNLSVLFMNFGSPLPGVYGITLEGFEPTEDALLALIDTVQYRNGDPTRLAVKVHGGYQFGCQGIGFESVLATFLIGVDQYCWFQCSEHYYVTPNVGDTYIREFASGTVTVFNATTGNGTTFWIDLFPTRNHLPQWVQELQVKQHTVGIDIFDVLKQRKNKREYLF
ncbi:hypothetical protein RFI_09723, partial [Reticulomyxa filosa]